jgi:chromosome segregation ATPase
MRIFTDNELQRMASIANTLKNDDYPPSYNQSLDDFVELTKSHQQLRDRYMSLRTRFFDVKKQLHHVNSRVHEIKKGFQTVVNNATNGKSEQLAWQVLFDTANALQVLKEKFHQKPKIKTVLPKSSAQDRYLKDAQAYLSRLSLINRDNVEVISGK